QVNVIRDAIVAEGNHVVALRQILWIGRRHGLPCFAAVDGDVVITAGAWFWRSSGLKRSSNDVVRILRIDRDRDFSRVDWIRVGDTHDLLCGSERCAEEEDA